MVDTPTIIGVQIIFKLSPSKLSIRHAALSNIQSSTSGCWCKSSIVHPIKIYARLVKVSSAVSDLALYSIAGSG